ncbi:MAG: hypothetical protein H7Z14_12020 [Anaerolineae bacterium]|nr:hypothetical protein [Phycisphaerae bacterium]
MATANDIIVASLTTAKMMARRFTAPVPKPRPMFKTLGELANFMALHATVHIGQITVIRRSLGRPPII